VLLNLNQINRIWFQHCSGGFPEVFQKFSGGFPEVFGRYYWIWMKFIEFDSNIVPEVFRWFSGRFSGGFPEVFRRFSWGFIEFESN
jgi:hypothetical protein